MNPPIVLELRKFVAPEFVFGLKARFLAGQYVRNFAVNRVLLVSDPGVAAAGWTEDVMDSLRESGVEYSVFDRVSPNPRNDEVMAGAEAYRDCGCQAIVAVGGGSPMDCAKGIGIVSSNLAHINEFEGADRIPVPGPPLICIPTTAGSSADVSQFAIIGDPERKVKMAIVSKMLVPDAALIDSETLVTMPPYLTACTGMDALSHAIEAYVSNANSPVTDMHALEAIRLIGSYLLPSIYDPHNLEWRGKMMLASLLAGLAFSNAILGTVHAMAHSLGGLLDLAHGECNAILLQHVIDYNFQAVPERYIAVGEALDLKMRGMPAEDSKQVLLQAIRHLQNEAGVGRSLTDLGVQKADLPALAEKAVQDVCMATNPRSAGRKEIEEIYEKALG